MKFWQSFSKKSVLKQLGFALVIFAILIPLSSWDSNRQVKVTFDEDGIFVKSKKYSLSLSYQEIGSADLDSLAAPGSERLDCFDDDVLRTGMWENDTWGEYYIVADLDTTNCVVLHLKDGRTFVFSCKNDETTASYYEQLLPYLN